MTDINPDQPRQERKPSIALIGLRGSGKSTVGRELADRLGGDCLDTDAWIEQEAGQSIADIFAQEGEVGFRRREREAVARIVAMKPTVISVGGGAVLDEGNVQKLRAVAMVVWLTAPADILWQRTSADPATVRSRPPLTDREGLAEVQHLITRRAARYQQAANLTLDTTNRTPREIAQAIATNIPR